MGVGALAESAAEGCAGTACCCRTVSTPAGAEAAAASCLSDVDDGDRLNPKPHFFLSLLPLDALSFSFSLSSSLDRGDSAPDDADAAAAAARLLASSNSCSWCLRTSASAGVMPWAWLPDSSSAVTYATDGVAAPPFCLWSRSRLFAMLAPGTPNSETASEVARECASAAAVSDNRSPLWNMLLRERTDDLRASLPRLPILRSMTEADETVDEIEMLSVELFILLLRRPKRRPELDGSDPPAPVGPVPCCPRLDSEAWRRMPPLRLAAWPILLSCAPASPFGPLCRFEADDAAKREGRTGEAPLGGVRGSMIECDVSDELELLVRLARPILLESRLEDDVLPSSFSESALRSLFRNMDEPFPLALLDDDVCGDVLLLVMTEEAFESVDWCPLAA